ncbi:HNH endonuclease family protein [Streptomyces alfalfae]
MAPRLPAAGLVLAGALAASVCGPLSAPGSAAEAAPAHRPATVGGGTALSQLNNLTRKRVPLTGYSRDAFGLAWSDEGTVEMSGNTCPTHQDILARDLDDAVRAEDGCTVLSDVLHDRYMGRTIGFKRDPRTFMAAQIDHIVPLTPGRWSWSGAREMTAEQRLNYSNEPDNSIAADGPTNAGKGAATWMPPRSKARCWYASAQARVKTKYHLSVTPSEKTALRTALGSCPTEAAQR